MLYILAGNYGQAENWRRRIGLHPKDVVYVNEESQLRGVFMGSPYVQIDNWYANQRSQQIMWEIVNSRMALLSNGLPREAYLNFVPESFLG